MFGGKIAAFGLAKMLGKRQEVDPAWISVRDVLKARPGDNFSRSPLIPQAQWRPVFFCSEEIPCNPCTTVCPVSSISLRPIRGTIMDLPYFSGTTCIGCFSCVAVCPGLGSALSAGFQTAKRSLSCHGIFDGFSRRGDNGSGGQEGEFIEKAPVIGRRRSKKHGTWLLSFKTSLENASQIAGIRVQSQEVVQSTPEKSDKARGDVIVCRCERVYLSELVAFIKENKVRDINQLKSIRVGMGACGGKTCSQLVARAFSLAGVDASELEPSTSRPLFMEIPMGEIVNEGLTRIGGKQAGERGAP